MLARLLTSSSGDVVCLEVFDDVGVEKADGSRVAEQAKSTHGGNPVSDRAVGLWKSLANWVKAVEGGALDPAQTSFVLYVSSQVTMGKIASTFHGAKNLDNATAAVTDARNALWGTPPDFPDKDSVAETLAKYVALVLDPEKATLVAQVVSRMTIVLGSGSPQGDLRPLLLAKLVSPDSYEVVVAQALGWVKRETDLLLEKGLPAFVTYDAFHEALLNFVRLHDRQEMFRSFAGTPSKDEINKEQALRTYVRQLELIGTETDDILAAINDHLRAVADRTLWAEKGYLSAPMLIDFEKELQLTWKNNRDRIEIREAGFEPRARGKLLLLDCCRHDATLSGHPCPRHFTRGSFHAMADTRDIGWHPDFRNLLNSSKEQE